MSETAEPAAMLARGDGAQDVVALLDGVPLTPDEAEYVEADRQPTRCVVTVRPWRQFTPGALRGTRADTLHGADVTHPNASTAAR